jgi:glycine cleavage system regulatory protein
MALGYDERRVHGATEQDSNMSSMSIVVSVLGPDRPGLVRLLSDCAATVGANWADCVMATFAGQFAGTVHFQVDSARADSLRAALKGLAANGLQVQLSASAALVAGGARHAMTLELVGNDRPGIIQSISGQLASLGVNICKMHSHISSAPMAGGDLFNLRAELEVPDVCPTAQLRDALESLANELQVDIVFDAAATQS